MYCPISHVRVVGSSQAVKEVQARGRRCVVATPRVLKPDEERLWQFYLKLGADALLARPFPIPLPLSLSFFARISRRHLSHGPERTMRRDEATHISVTVAPGTMIDFTRS